jgi:sialate O-acetylesterase
MPVIPTAATAATLILAPLFTDHMVLQRGQENPIWGSDVPGEKINITVEDATGALNKIMVTADGRGRWSAKLPNIPTGGPYTIVIDGSKEEKLDDVLVGEVWLVSGQSNMEFQVERATNSKLETATASNRRVRHFKVAQATSDVPRDTVFGQWEVNSPASVGEFSAIGYFFAREISERLDVPVGIINSTWGGTCVEAWTSYDVISKYVPEEELHPSAETIAKQKTLYDEYLVIAAKWRVEHMPQDPGNSGFDKGWAKADFDDSSWETMKEPNYWQNKGIPYNGAFWFRKTIEIPQDWAGRDLVLSLGSVDDYDTTYFNGEKIGEVVRGTPDSYLMQRKYTIPAALAKAGKAVVTVRVFDDFGNGGFGGSAEAMAIAPADGSFSAINISGEWKFKVEHNIGIVPSSVFAGSPGAPLFTQPQNRPAYLYNGMISALIPYGMRGVLWYQGEQNENNWQTYGERVRAMIRDWRNRWGEGDFPFYYVQLATFGTSSDWADLRLRQDEALKEPNTGRALAIDVGNISDIHPTNKQEVARRLALVALSETYGFSGFETSGPVFESASFKGSKAIVAFSHANGLHTSDNSPNVLGFEVAGADRIYHAASAAIVKDAVEASSDKVSQPIYVRYAHASAPEVNLVNGEGLPAAPFKAE